jgi:hypothetical protein
VACNFVNHSLFFKVVCHFATALALVVVASCAVLGLVGSRLQLPPWHHTANLGGGYFWPWLHRPPVSSLGSCLAILRSLWLCSYRRGDFVLHFCVVWVTNSPFYSHVYLVAVKNKPCDMQFCITSNLLILMVFVI